ncbi:unspecified product [Plasmodium ovale curtisi]|uniref:Unspecified product n=1 Tax=Plasmodium ovale curtisi TaxID=864141 RepID=A0A1A8VTL0_PLAOA|nr:unspecified product [Plasmodium ovale curtisi]
MTEDINVNPLPPYLFYEALKKDGNLDQWLKELYTIYYKSYSYEDYLKEFGAKLVRNYTDVFKKNKNISPTYRCRYLNYWMDLEIKRYRIRSIENSKKTCEALNTQEAPSYAAITGDDVSSSQQWINTSITGLTVMGIFNILFILYKFTSLGFWV